MAPKGKAYRPNSAVEAEFGREPKDIDMNDLTLSGLVRVFSWFNYKNNLKDARDVLNKNLPEIKWNEVSSSDINPSFAWMYLMEKNGCIITPLMKEKRDNYIQEIFKKYLNNTEEKDTPSTEKDISLSYSEKTYISNFNEIEDSFWKSFNQSESFEKTKTLISTLTKGNSMEILNDCVKPIIQELENLNSDKDLKEAYKIYNSVNIRVAKKFYQSISDYIQFSSSASRVVRTRKKKIIPIEKKLKDLKYLKISDTFKMVSVLPDKIIGAKIVWAFNTKTRDLSVMESQDGFDIKGTTLINGTSVKTKKIRKPEFLKDLFSTTKMRMEKEFSALKVTERQGNFRINGDMIIAKVF
jgi:hypothetical protein